jgi:hypothetical protein
MPANFVIVCGGSGRGILSRFSELGFDGALQIDVQNEMVNVQDGRILKFALPIPQVIEQTPNSVASLQSYRVRLEQQWKKYHADQHHAGEFTTCLDKSCIDFKKQVTHVATAVVGTVPPNILAGMSQNPIIGRSYITRPLVTNALLGYISQLAGLGNAMTDVNVWIVASTCGGTGNGIVHHVADVVRQVFGQYKLTVKFVRIGGASYVSVNPLAMVSTFWSVLTDYGYSRKYKDAILP